MPQTFRTRHITLWSYRVAERLRFKQWDAEEGAVAYDVANGDTHVVEPLAMELLHVLRESSPRAAQSLVDEMLIVFEGEPATRVAEAVAASLSRLQQLGLAASAPP